MGVFQKILNLDNYFKRTTGDKIIINDIKYYSEQDRTLINTALMTVYDTDTISIIPSCDCVDDPMRGGYLKGRLCHKCGTTVKDVYEKTDPLLWLQRMDDTPKFMNPHFWLMMRVVMTSSMDCLRWLSDTGYNPPKELPDYLVGIQNTLPNFERSYPYLIANVEKVLVYLQNHATFKTLNRRKVITGLIGLYKKEKRNIYSDTVPIINKRLFVMENTSKGKFTNLAVSDVIDLTLLYVKAVNEVNPTPGRRSNIMSRTMSKLADVYMSYYKNYASSKPGIFRKHIYGARSHFTFRAVITSISGPHRYNQILVPWSIGVTAFRPHLLNLLYKRGYGHKKASALLFGHVSCYHPLLDELLQQLVSDSRYEDGIPVTIQRNPSLLQGSAQRVFISRFKTDVLDTTISLSILITKLSNADFDGDEMNVTMLLDNYLSDLMSTMDSPYSVPGLSEVAEVSRLLSMPSTTVATISNYLYSNDDVNVGNDPKGINGMLKTVLVEV